MPISATVPVVAMWPRWQIGVFALVLAAAIHPGPLRAQDAPRGWIQDHNWLVLGPLGNADGCDPGVRSSASWIAPLDIAEISPGEGDPAAIDFSRAAATGWEGAGAGPVWRALGSLGFGGSDLVDLAALAGVLGVPAEDRVALAVTYVSYSGARPILVQVCDSSDDSIQIWVNNARVQEVGACRDIARGCSDAAPAVLLPGKNAIKVLVWQGCCGWSFRLRLQLADGEVIGDEHPDFAFGADPLGALELGPPAVERRNGEVLQGCLATGGYRVKLVGDGRDGPDVELVEFVQGPAWVTDISNGGKYDSVEEPPPERTPVGIFADSVDVGEPCEAGETVQNPDGSYTVSSAGADIWQNGDEFQFAYVEATGDFDMRAHLRERDWAPLSRWGKGGLMAREDLGPTSRYAMIQTHGEDPLDSDRFAGRPTHGGRDNFETTPFPPGDPDAGQPGTERDYLRLVRRGQLFTGYLSQDGVDWEVIGQMGWGPVAPPTVLLGLALSAHSDPCLSASLTFDQVTIQGGDDPDPDWPSGGRIVWELSREELNDGVSYRLRGNGSVRLYGHDGMHVTSGFDHVEISSADADLGIFDVAHDIGNPCFQGSTSYESARERYTISGGGRDIWTDGDEFQYAYRELAGDFSLRAHVAERNWAAGTRWGKFGIMARQDCTGRSRYSMVQVHGEDPQDGDRFAWRATQGGDDNQELALPAGVHRDWLRLDRSGDVFTGFFSLDGVDWREIGSHSWDGAPRSVLIGLAGSAHSNQSGGCEGSTLVFDGLDLVVPDFPVERRVDCPSETDRATVLLAGVGAPGPDIEIEETIAGTVDVRDISHGGRFTPLPPLQIENPVGIFDGTLDVGEPCEPGSTFAGADGSYTITASGADIWRGGDEFHYAYRVVTGDFAMQARIAETSWAPGSRWGKAGIMVRQNGDPRSRYTMLQTHGEDPQDGDRLAGRPTPAGSDNFEIPAVSGTQYPWQRLERSGSVFEGYFSVDGLNWDLVGSVDWGDRAPETVLLGLALTSHAGCDSATIRFSDITIEGGDGPPQPLASRGGTIVWKAAREDLETALSYTLQKTTGSASRVFADGVADGLKIVGPREILLTAVQDEGLGIFDVAHDIGDPCTPGATVHVPATDSYEVRGSGADIWTDGDQFQYCYRKVRGDFSLTARIAERDWAPGSRWGKVGIMARQDCSSRSRYSMLQSHGEDAVDGDRFAFRATPGGDDNDEIGILPDGEHRDWLRLERSGNVFSGYFSGDGETWGAPAGVHDWGDGAPEEVLLGLAVSSHADCVPTTITFDELELGGEETGPVFRRGDTDGSGVVDISDPIYNLTFQFVGGIPVLPCVDAADVDNSGVVDISDPIYNLTFQFVGGIAPPPAPGPQTCGPDSGGEDLLGCESYPQERC